MLLFWIFDRNEFAQYYRDTKVAQHPEHLVDIALLLGNDYLPRIRGNGPAKILNDGGLIDQLAASGDRERFVREHCCSNSNALPGHAARYELARRYILHAPVLERSSDGSTRVVPLNPLPAGVKDLAEYLSYDFEAHAAVPAEQYGSIYDVDILPLNGGSIDQQEGPRYSAEENPHVLVEELLPIFARLDFDAIPTEYQPTQCLTA